MRLDRTPPGPGTWSATSAIVIALGASACNREITCTTEVTEGRGSFRGTTSGRRSEADLGRESLRVACAEMCAANKSVNADGCVSRCAVDVQSQKIGARTTCKGGGRQ